MIRSGEFLSLYGMNALIALPQSAFCNRDGEKFVKAEFL